MSLVTCKECNTEISDTATSCPKCGAKKAMGIGKIVLIVVGTIVALFIAIAVFTPESREQKAFNKASENLQDAVDRANSLTGK